MIHSTLPPITVLTALAVIGAWGRISCGAPPLDLPTRAEASEQLAISTASGALTTNEWRQLDEAVQRGLAFLASRQQPDGSFPTLDHAQPAVTSLCVLSFMAHGHLPGRGRYGQQLERALGFILACQKRSGLIILLGPDGLEIDRNLEHFFGVAGAYDHAISSLALAEAYGTGAPEKADRLSTAIEQSLAASLKMQRWPKNSPYDRGGWRYVIDYDQTDSDLSVTGWELMFLRSARNAGYRVPEQAISDAVGYIRRTFDDSNGAFNYRIQRGDGRSRGMIGAGILALGHAGYHHSQEAKQSAEQLLGYNFHLYNDNEPFPTRDRYHYSLFMCCQGMYQIGSPYWERFFPTTVEAVLAHQNADGSWDAESFHRDRRYGNAYTTALTILALGAPNQLLPIFQR